MLPESRMFLRAKQESQMRENHNEIGKTKAFMTETKKMLKANWKRAIWAVVSEETWSGVPNHIH